MAAIARCSAGYFECGIPDANLEVQLNADVIDRLGAGVMEGFKAVPRRGLEVGGLLLGRVEGDRIVVDDFKALTSEHQRGPSWLLSESDRRLLAETVLRANDGETVTGVVGLYRSQTRAGFEISEEDAALMAEYSDRGARVFLLVKPEAGGRSTAVFAAGDGLHAKSEAFPFRGGRPAVPAPTPIAAARAQAAPTPVPAPALAPESAHREHVPRLRSARAMAGMAADRDLAGANTYVGKQRAGRRFSTSVLWTVGILASAAAAGYGLARWWTTTPAGAASASSLALHALWSGASLDLHWNRNSPAIRSANRGTLSIDDGSQRRQLELKAEELMQGSVQYWPTSSDVHFKLEVFTPAGASSESVRVLSVPLPAVANSSASRVRDAGPAKPFATVDFEALAGRKPGTPPKPLLRVLPAGSADLRNRLRHEVQVDVRIEIDTAGRVRRAELVGKRAYVRREFENLALGASRGWTFTPARNGERRASSAGVLHYRFGSS